MSTVKIPNLAAQVCSHLLQILMKCINFLGRIIGLFRLSYLTPGLMAAGVTEVIVEKDQVSDAKEESNSTTNKIAIKANSATSSTNKALTHQSKKSK